MSMARVRTQSSSSQSSEHSVSMEWQVGGKDLLHSMSSSDEYDDDLEGGDQEASEYAKFLYGYGKVAGKGSNNSGNTSSATSSSPVRQVAVNKKVHGFHGGHVDHSKSVLSAVVWVTSLCLTVGYLLWRVLPPPEVSDLIA